MDLTDLETLNKSSDPAPTYTNIVTMDVVKEPISPTETQGWIVVEFF